MDIVLYPDYEALDLLIKNAIAKQRINRDKKTSTNSLESGKPIMFLHFLIVKSLHF